MNKNCEELAEELSDEGFFEDYIQDSAWTRDFKPKKCEEMLIAEAGKRNLALTEEEDFDPDTFFWHLYDNTEKGIS